MRKRITEKEVAATVEALLDDYFVGYAERKGRHVYFTLLNGQKFKFTIRKK